MGEVLSNYGYEVEITPQSRDGGKDLIAIQKGADPVVITYVECKRYKEKRKVSVNIVREYFGVINDAHVEKGMIVTTSGFTKDAIDFAYRNDKRLSLVDKNKLYDWLSEVANWKFSKSNGLIVDPYSQNILTDDIEMIF